MIIAIYIISYRKRVLIFKIILCWTYGYCLVWWVSSFSSVVWDCSLSLLDLTVISSKGITDVKRWAQPSLGSSKPQKQPTTCSNEHQVKHMCIPWIMHSEDTLLSVTLCISEVWKDMTDPPQSIFSIRCIFSAKYRKLRFYFGINTLCLEILNTELDTFHWHKFLVLLFSHRNSDIGNFKELFWKQNPG